MRSHLDERPYECKMCTLKFDAFLRLKQHCRSMHPGFNLVEIIDYHNSRCIVGGYDGDSGNGGDGDQVRYVSFFNNKFRFAEKVYRPAHDEPSISELKSLDADGDDHRLSLVVQADCSISRRENRQCEPCRVEFGCSAELLCHVWLKHMGASQLVCWICSVEYYNQADLINHLNHKHLNNELKYELHSS